MLILFLKTKRRGQLLIITTLTIGGILFGAVTIAGFLMTYQIRSTTDITNSAKAIFAADTGLEWGLYQFFKPNSTQQAPALSNGATYTTTCFPDADCGSASTTKIRAEGSANGTARAFELNL